MAEKKNGLFGRIAKRLSNAFKRSPKTGETALGKGSTTIKPPTEEKNIVSARPVIRSEMPERTESPFATVSLPFIAENKPALALPPKPRPVFKKIVKPVPKPAPKKRKRKRYPDEKRLKRVFRMGQYLSRIRQKRHTIRKALKTKAVAKKLKVSLKKTKKKTRLTKKAVKMLEQEMYAVSPAIPLPGEEQESAQPPFPRITFREENRPVLKEEFSAQISVEKKENEPETEENQKPLVSSGAPDSEPVQEPEPENAPPAPQALKIETPPKKMKAEKPAPKPGKKETPGKQEALEAEIRAEIRKQRETIPKEKPGKSKKTAVSITIKEKAAKPKEAALPPKKETRPPKDDIEELRRLIAEKFEGQVAPQQLRDLQQKVSGLLEQKMVTKSEMEENIRMVDANRLLEGFTKLLGLIELNERQPPEQPSFEMPSTIGPQQRPEKIIGTEKELEKKELITDFDKILEIVRERGTITLNELASELDIDKRLLKEAVDILEENNLVIQEYPPFGSPRIIDPAFLEKKGKKSENE